MRMELEKALKKGVLALVLKIKDKVTCCKGRRGTADTSP